MCELAADTQRKAVTFVAGSQLTGVKVKIMEASNQIAISAFWESPLEIVCFSVGPKAASKPQLQKF